VDAGQIENEGQIEDDLAGTGRAWDDGAAVEDHELVLAARRLAAHLLAPAAAEVDRTRVPRSHLSALGDAGLLALHEVSPAVARRTNEIIAGADLATWFVAIQHAGAMRLALQARRSDLADELAGGRLLGGVAFAHLRRAAGSPLRARRVRQGWQFQGTAPWYTGWGINDVAAVGALAAPATLAPGARAGGTAGDPDGVGDVVFALIPAVRSPGLTASPVMDVAAVRGASTVTLTLDDFEVRNEQVLLVSRWRDWAEADAARTANVVPAVFGVAESALGLLAAVGRDRHEPAAADAAYRLRGRLAAVRAHAYRLIDAAAAGPDRQERLALRALALRLLIDTTSTLVAAGAGGSMAASAPAQRKAREALFLLVQAQTADARRASLTLAGT